TPLYGADCPAIVAYRVTWPDEAIILGTLGDIRAKAKAAGFTRTALILIGRALGETAFTDSRLYAPDHSHVLRAASSKPASSHPRPAKPRRSRQSGSGTKSQSRTKAKRRG